MSTKYVYYKQTATSAIENEKNGKSIKQDEKRPCIILTNVG